MQVQSKQLNFEGQNIYVGIDVHLKSWTVCIMTEHLEHKKFTQPPRADVLYKYLCGNFPGAHYHSAYESGFSGFWAHRELESFGINSMVTNAADVPTGQKEKIQKDDAVDSRKLARSLRSGDLDAIYVPSASTIEERALVRMRASLVKDTVGEPCRTMTRFKQRVKSFLYFFGISYPERFYKSSSHWSKKFLKWLKEEISFSEKSGRQALDTLIQEVEEQRKVLLSVTRQIKELSESPKYASNVRLLKTVPGIGLVTAMHLLTEIEKIERFEDTDHFAAYIGLVPGRHDSGDVKNNGEMTFRGQSILKKCIVEASWIAARRDPALSLAYGKYVSRMEANKAIIRISRKLVNRIYFVLKNKKEYVSCVVK
jgi:transposase